jgi:acyl-CoA hydrolase/GNAT superfamily N-acetyltransferase
MATNTENPAASQPGLDDAPDPDWQRRYAAKIASPQEAIARFRQGDRILLASGSAVPLGLLDHLVGPDSRATDNEILHLLTLGEAPYVDPRFAGRFRHNALFIGPNVRAAVAQGRADYTPVFLGEIPRLIRHRQIPIDVMMVSVTPPNARGDCSLGPHVDIAPAGIEAARLVIAQVNSHLPWTCGQSRVSVDDLDVLVDLPRPLPELPPAPVRGETEAIARNVARLIMDGATLQIGIGALPDAILRHLSDHRDLGIHTEMFSDGLIDLIERGAVTGAKKSLHPGKIVASIVMGTRRVYDFIDRNPMVELYPVDYTNDPFVIARHDYMTAINTAIEVDLTGQVCSDSIGDRFYSGIGGQVDFIRGAARARGGKPIIALPSTARDGNVSRIKPALADGAGVVTTRGDVHFVVTEYGIAYLHGKTVRQRAMELIEIAHPKFRPWLLGEAKLRHYVDPDTREPRVQVSAYPSQFASRLESRAGVAYRIRPIKPTDEAMLHEMFYAFTRKEIYRRFFGDRPGLAPRTLRRFCSIDYEREMTLLATRREDVATRVIGFAIYLPHEENGPARAAIYVAEHFENQGIGKQLIKHICGIAKKRGLVGLVVELGDDTEWAWKLFEPYGHVTPSRRDDGTSQALVQWATPNAGES